LVPACGAPPRVWLTAPVRQIYPAADGPEIGAPGPEPAGQAALDAIAGLYPYPDATPAASGPWVRANMVMSADGAASLDGRSGSLSGSADRAVFSVLRSLADVILVGAATARIERYRPVRLEETWPSLRAGRPPTPPIAVLTSRMAGLDADSPVLAAGPGQARTIVVTTEAAPAGSRSAVAANADVIVAGSDLVRPAAVIRALADRGYRRLLTEGGPRLLEQIVAAGLLDELCLTVSPVLAGGFAGRIVAVPPAGGTRADNAALPGQAGPTGLRLAHVLADSGYLLCRYLRADEDERCGMADAARPG
jgi:riboflavin biosynthesis pyrimidine reductase